MTEKLTAIATSLYMAGKWTCASLDEIEQKALWEALRDELNLLPGTATAAGVGSDLYWSKWHNDPQLNNWHLIQPDGEVYMTLRLDDDGLWISRELGASRRFIDLDCAKTALEESYLDFCERKKRSAEWVEKRRKELDAELDKGEQHLKELDAWHKLPYWKRLINKRPEA